MVYDGREEVARHDRLIACGAARLGLDHYLEALIRKPGALPGATALDQARAVGRSAPIHDAWWQAAVKAHGAGEGTRARIEVPLRPLGTSARRRTVGQVVRHQVTGSSTGRVKR